MGSNMDRQIEYSGFQRGLSPPRPINGQRELLAYGPIDAPRVPTQVARDVYDHAVAGPHSSSHFVTRTPLPLDSARSLPRLHPRGAISHRSFYAVQLNCLCLSCLFRIIGLSYSASVRSGFYYHSPEMSFR